jgi:hypothetical protein
VIVGLLAVVAVLSVRTHCDDPDMWWHLKLGQIIWTTRTIPLSDLFSYTTNHQASIPQEWLAQLTLYGAYKWAGYSGLMLWLCFFTTALLVAGYGLCVLYSGNAKVAFAGAMVIWLFATVGLAARPQLIGYLLLIAELALIHLGRTRNPRWFFWLPLLFALWINCHASFFFGLIVAGSILFASLYSFQAGSLVAPRWDPRCRRMLAMALVLAAAALFLNPDGIRQIQYPLDTLLHQPLGLSSVSEWKAPQFTDARGVALLAVLLCIFLLVAIRRSELLLDEFQLLAIGTWMALTHARMLFVFGILAAPILSRQLASAFPGHFTGKNRIWLNAMILGASLMAIGWAFPGRQSLEKQVEMASPVKAVEFIKANHLAGPMLNDYVYGGYLIWAAPEYPVFVDGRADVFEWTGVLEEYENWAALQNDPNVLLQKYRIRFCLLNRQSAMVRVLPLLPEWKLVYADGNSVIFLRATN